MSLCDLGMPYVRAITPYQPGKPITQLAREMGLPVERIVKLASNENPLGMSPKARAALEQALNSLERYPDDFELKHALAQHTGLGMERIVLGNGSNDVLDILARVFLAPGRSAVFSQHAFAVYPLATLSAGGEPIAVPAKDFGHAGHDRSAKGAQQHQPPHCTRKILCNGLGHAFAGHNAQVCGIVLQNNKHKC